MKKQATTEATKQGTAAKRARPVVKSRQKRQIGDQEREEMIRVAAYHIAARRGFGPGSELDDWLAAEQSIQEHFPPA
jgi:hypothetical protein